MASPFIDDGYTIDAIIPANPGKWDEVAITYRPMNADEEAAVYVRKSANPFQTTTRLYAEAFAGDGSRTPAKLLSWDVKDRHGKVVPISAETLIRLTSDFFEELKAYLTLLKQPLEKNSEGALGSPSSIQS